MYDYAVTKVNNISDTVYNILDDSHTFKKEHKSWVLLSIIFAGAVI